MPWPTRQVYEGQSGLGSFRLAMAVTLDMQSADFDERFAALVAAKRESSADVDLTVADIIDDLGQALRISQKA